MVDHGIFSPVLPEIGPEAVARLAATVEAERKAGQAASSIRRLAALFPPDPELAADVARRLRLSNAERSEEHTSELQSLMRNSYAVFCLKKKKQKQHT